MESRNADIHNPLQTMSPFVKKILGISGEEDIQSISDLSTQLRVPISELQQMISYKVGFHVGLKIEDYKTLAVEKRIGGKILGHTLHVEASITGIENSNIHLSLSGPPMILSKLPQIKHQAFSFSDDNKVVVHLNEISQLKTVMEKIEMTAISFAQNNVVVDLKVHIPSVEK